MTVMQWTMLVVAIPTSLAYACRLGALDRRHHRAIAIGWHLALGSAAIYCAGQAIAGPSAFDATLLGCSALWIIASYSDWRHSVPLWVDRPRPSWWHRVNPLD